MPYNIEEILELPVDEQKAIAKTILQKLFEKKENVFDEEINQMQQIAELDKRIEEVESGNYITYSLDEVKQKLSEKWASK